MKRILYSTLAATLLIGCSVTHNLQRHNNTASLSQLSKHEREVQQQSVTPQIVSREREGKSYFIAPAESVDGEQMISMKMEQVTVVSKFRTTPERNGEVTLDFVVSIPRELFGSSRNVIITPQLHHDNGEVESLESLTMRGILIDKIQQRDYWQYETYVARRAPTEQRAEQIFRRLVKFPRAEDARLDSLVESSSHITYYYSQRLKTNETTKRMKVTLAGRVEGVDDTIYTMPPSDTLTYTVSSMLSFLDLAPRYHKRIIDKYVTVSDRRHIQFRVGDSRVIDTIGDNAEELRSIRELMQEITSQQEFYVDTITLTATSSPEGLYSYNEQLAQRRANALKRYLGRESESLITVRWVGEDWAELRRRIVADSVVQHRAEIVKIIDSQSDEDLREAQIKSRFAVDYAYIKSRIYPQLRSVNFRYNLRRKGMVKDTIQTTELDTLYTRGMELLQGREYAKALYILNDYRDRNTIIAHLSMGHDTEALDLLSHQADDATTLYLRAIALSRLGRGEEARETFERACDKEPKMKFRANLDPEITKLLKL